jgi:hypothetical protein
LQHLKGQPRAASVLHSLKPTEHRRRAPWAPPERHIEGAPTNTDTGLEDEHRRPQTRASSTPAGPPSRYPAPHPPAASSEKTEKKGLATAPATTGQASANWAISSRPAGAHLGPSARRHAPPRQRRRTTAAPRPRANTSTSARRAPSRQGTREGKENRPAATFPGERAALPAPLRRRRSREERWRRGYWRRLGFPPWSLEEGDTCGGGTGGLASQVFKQNLLFQSSSLFHKQIFPSTPITRTSNIFSQLAGSISRVSPHR